VLGLGSWSCSGVGVGSAVSSVPFARNFVEHFGFFPFLPLARCRDKWEAHDEGNEGEATHMLWKGKLGGKRRLKSTFFREMSEMQGVLRLQKVRPPLVKISWHEPETGVPMV
jgi:hypothetical protein